jgi:hypothetical protein
MTAALEPSMSQWMRRQASWGCASKIYIFGFVSFEYMLHLILYRQMQKDSYMVKEPLIFNNSRNTLYDVFLQFYI